MMLLILNIVKFAILYIFLFNPILQVLGFGVVKLLYVPTIIYILFNIKLLSCVKYVLLFFLFNIIFSVIHFISNGDIIQLNNSIVLLMECCLLPLWIVCKIINKWEIYKTIFWESIIASLISLCMIVMPDFGLYIKEYILLINDHEKKFWYRGYGFATDLLYSYAIFHGIVLSYVLNILFKYKTLLFLIPLYIIAIFLNARSGFIPVLLVIIFLTIKYPIKYFTIILIFVLAFLSIVPYINSDYSQTVTWAVDFFFQVYDVITNGNNAEGSTTDAMSEMIYFPRNFKEWIFGSGYNILYTNRSTDIGYLIQLNYGGILYIVFLAVSFCNLFRYFIRKNKDKVMAILTVITILLLNIKGDMLCSNIVIRTFFLLVIYSMIYDRKVLSYE